MRKSLMRLTLRQLQIFNEVCDLRSYSRAAEEMSLTQPAVSLQIRQLEELIGQPLFDYVGKKLYMTEAAEALQRASRDIFGRLENLDMQLSDMQGSLQGQLKLAVESSAKYFVPHLFAAFKRQHPEVHLQLTVVNRAQVIRRLSDNRDDLVIMSMVPQDMELEFLPFLNNPIVAVAPRTTPEPYGSPALARPGALHPGTARTGLRHSPGLRGVLQGEARALHPDPRSVVGRSATRVCPGRPGRGLVDAPRPEP